MGANLVLAVICGWCCGVIGFAPLLIGLRMTRKVTKTSNFGHMAVLLISLFLSFVLMFAFALGCNALAHDMALPFVLAEAVALSVVAIVFGIAKGLKNDGKGR